MPRIAIYKYFVFYIVSFDLTERYHIHIAKTKSGRTGTAKFWLSPVELFEAGDLTGKEINLIEKKLAKNQAAIIREIDNFAVGKKVKTIMIK